ncbi:barstar family protein [Micromonospora olivasterospora]|uniref:Barstar (Barnase inhibitor) n=1 Tax=Micromonospora olivasterospora TaxID=1880 RepID=A0A562IH03_MICOL|nr:barstar family protein [Micromonospora olivasterospora]TWH70005.1 barstar (barnase inhibitor) [Micromonospora olivasterospora]
MTAEPVDADGATAGPPEQPVRLAADAARTRAALRAALVDALDLPAYTGPTWDALSDVLRDRLDAGPLTLVVDDAGRLLADEPPGQFALLLAVLGDAAAAARCPLRVVLRDAPERLPSLRRRAAEGVSRR